MAIEGVSGTGLEAQSSQTDAVKSLIRWESPHPLSIAGVTYDAPATWPKRRTSARGAIYRRVSYPLLGKQAIRARGVECRSRLRCAGFIQSTGRSSASMCASSVPAASVSSVDAPMVNPFAVYRMDGGTTRIVGPGAIITAARSAGPTEQKGLRKVMPAAVWVLPTSIIIQATIG